MNAQHSLIGADRVAQAACCLAVARAAGDRSSVGAAEAVPAAQARLAMVAAQSQRRKALSNNGKYYGVTKAHREEIVHSIPSPPALEAVVTRNHYGSLVLNAARALFMDVDVDQPDLVQRWSGGLLRGRPAGWQMMLDDLRTVLGSEADKGFRIYRTAAGFRILATTHEFEPGSPPSNQLMQAVGADAAFVELCRIQNNFRARLTPKPWRCGTRLPPNSYPRESAEQQRRFTQWRTQYEHACHRRATCQFLEHIGPSDTHECIAPIIELHDRETKAFQSLALA